VPLAFAAVVLIVAGCGGGGGSTSTSTRGSTVAGADASKRAANSAEGPFKAAIPSGWRSGMAAAAGRGYRVLYAAIGPRVAGVTADLIVTRAPARALGASAMPAVALAGLHRDAPANQDISRPRRFSVGGAPAVAVAYMHPVAPNRIVFHEAVDILHDGWLYIVTSTAAKATGVTGALSAMLTSWRWT
jgi:hypothetical protein